MLAHTLFKDIKVNVDMAKDKASRAVIEIPLKSVQLFYLHCRSVMYVIKNRKEKMPIKDKKEVNFKHILMPLTYVLKCFKHQLICCLKTGTHIIAFKNLCLREPHSCIHEQMQAYGVL